MLDVLDSFATGLRDHFSCAQSAKQSYDWSLGPLHVLEVLCNFDIQTKEPLIEDGDDDGNDENSLPEHPIKILHTPRGNVSHKSPLYSGVRSLTLIPLASNP